MSKQTVSDGFDWSELWAGFKRQPDFIKRQWWFGYGWDGKTSKADGLKVVLEDILHHSSKKVIEEVMECAPDDVKKLLGYEEYAPKPATDTTDAFNLSVAERIALYRSMT